MDLDQVVLNRKHKDSLGQKTQCANAYSRYIYESYSRARPFEEDKKKRNHKFQ